ncbi:GNAT family N-acetyltransferase [Microbacterium pygmaeum]|uniref:Protein N-acetyltransferase, RimJ/RimL family n=1 Tax=Microbacterium pygmaeum TaxID=370764 RepID=A0A1G7WJD5_9MICO|nr:GNAT family protein [Microbacterium pygmaeum]SDG72075.1 Protein N-acetyltransferase, RimJ/RimL family [Microbacterium pygmaeum]
MSLLTSFATPPVLQTPRLTLVPHGPEHIDDVMVALADGDAMRLTGTRGSFTREQVLAHLHRIAKADDRADFAILDEAENYIGEVVLNELDEDNLAVNYRIALSGTSTRGRGYGTEAGRAAVEWAFGTAGVHRISLDVYSFNPAAQRSYEKIGFRVEGRARHTLFWDGEWVDSILMAMLATDPRP